ncbi:sigma-70 family RNA polymerase sigma factor [Calycomorphotria hydatis]|nr:sigma-70 family RNA polymerase sigma factor [Calycomorphotria hydatis]
MREDADALDERQDEFLRLFVEAYPQLHARVMTILGTPHDTEDTLQEACIVLWEKFEDFKPGTSFLSWSSAVAVNLARNAYRKRRRHRGCGLSDEIISQVSQVHRGGLELLELRRDTLRDCLHRLNTSDQQFLWTCYGHDGKFVGLARQLKVTVKAIYSKMERLRKRLYECVNRNIGKEFKS